MLRGTLDDFTLPDIFRLLSMAKRTGTLEVARSAGSGKVFFRSGDVYFAESSLTREPLGRKLVRARAITEGQLMKALDEHARAGRLGGTQEQTGGPRVGEILVASDLVSAEQLEAAVREQIEDSVFDLLRWELGEFEWEPGVETAVEVPIAVSVENLIMEASRRLDELEVIKRKIPSVDAVLRMAPKPPEDAVEINITPEEWRILVLVDGTRSVGAIAEAVSLDEFGAMRVLYGLVSAGLIELTPGHVEPRTAAVADPATSTDEPAPEDDEIEPEPPAAADEAPLFSLAVDLSPHPSGGDSNGSGSGDELSPSAPAFMAEDLSDEIPESLLSEMSAGLSPDAIELLDDAVSTETFDAPGPDELSTTLPPSEDGAPETPAPSAEDDAPAAQDAFDEPEAPVEAAADPAPAAAEATIDRAAVVRELAGLFNDDDRPRPQRASAASQPARPATPQRVEDDDQITKGLISRLIDGVKGL